MYIEFMNIFIIPFNSKAGTCTCILLVNRILKYEIFIYMYRYNVKKFIMMVVSDCAALSQLTLSSIIVINVLI